MASCLLAFYWCKASQYVSVSINNVIRVCFLLFRTMILQYNIWKMHRQENSNDMVPWIQTIMYHYSIIPHGAMNSNHYVTIFPYFSFPVQTFPPAFPFALAFLLCAVLELCSYFQMFYKQKLPFEIKLFTPCRYGLVCLHKFVGQILFTYIYVAFSVCEIIVFT